MFLIYTLYRNITVRNHNNLFTFSFLRSGRQSETWTGGRSGSE